MRVAGVCAGRNFIVKSVSRLGICSANVVFEHGDSLVQIARVRVPELLAEHLRPDEIELLMTYRALQMAKDFSNSNLLGPN